MSVDSLAKQISHGYYLALLCIKQDRYVDVIFYHFSSFFFTLVLVVRKKYCNNSLLNMCKIQHITNFLRTTSDSFILPGLLEVVHYNPEVVLRL